jgi:hypothetical protein
MKRFFLALLILTSFTVVSQNPTETTPQNKITLQKYVDDIKSKNASIKNVESINVMLNDLLIENLEECLIEPKNVVRTEVLVLETNGVVKEGTTPSIIITTRGMK